MRTTLLLLIVSLAGTPLIGQIPPATAANADDFRRLFEEREKLLSERRELEKSIEELSGRTRNLPSVESLERGLAKANRDLERSQKSKTPDPVNTLFLIVIAIILFGIMGTLEGKELAALLGGLSGYILGRADSRREKSTEAESGA